MHNDVNAHAHNLLICLSIHMHNLWVSHMFKNFYTWSHEQLICINYYASANNDNEEDFDARSRLEVNNCIDNANNEEKNNFITIQKYLH